MHRATWPSWGPPGVGQLPTLSPLRRRVSPQPSGNKKWVVSLICVSYCLLCALFVSGVLPSSSRHASTASDLPGGGQEQKATVPRRRLIAQQRQALGVKIGNLRGNIVDPVKTKTLSFTVCNGFANQRLALLNGMLLGKELGRAVVLPRFIVNGRQDDPSVTNYGGEAGADMTHFYNTTSFVEAMGRMGVQVVARPTNGSIVVVPEEATEAALGQQHPEDHLQFGCPLLRLGPGVFLRNEEFVISTLEALTPNHTLSLTVSSALKSLKQLSKTGTFNFLHLRLESDWMTHCSSWRFGLESDNCFSNTLTIDEHLQAKMMESDSPLYITFDSESVVEPVLAHVLDRLRSAGFQLVMRQDILPAAAGLPREIAALVEYYIALGSHKFVGNSVSTFSALLILEREQRGAWASYYNMGDIPLGSFMPLYQMPWVFTYNGHSPSVDYMIKAAVMSSQAARLTPFCIYNGTKADPIYSWLQENGVIMILHVPNWLTNMQSAFPTATKNSGWSPLYKSLDALFGTFQRIDVPAVWQLEQYNYVLFADADVVFERPITLQTFAQPLPKSLAMAYEMDDIFPCNAGVALMNLPYLRRTHKEFVEFVFSNPSLYYDGYGPGDQGALNQFYEDSMGRRCSLGEEFNAKPHKNGNLSSPFIVHFHGPKPNDYLRWKQDGTCAFGELCAKGADAACQVMERHRPFLPSCKL